MGEDLSAWALAARMGWTVAVAIVASLLLGLWIDSLLHTQPFGVLIFTFLGSVAAIVGIYRQAMAAVSAASRPKPGSHKPPPDDETDGDEDTDGDEE